MTETTGTPMPEMPTAATLGALLRQAREQQGYSLGEVAERLKFPARQVEALEAGVYEGLPEPVFIKGFLRSYARLLGVDEAQLNEQMKAIFPTDAAAVQAAQVMTKSTLDYRGMKEKKPFPRWVFGVVALAVLGAAIYAWQSKSSADNLRQTESASQVVANPIAMPGVDANNVSVIPMTPANMASGSAASGIAAASTPMAASAPAANVGAQTLVITVRYRSLLHVVNQKGEVLISQVVPAGSEHRFDNGAPYQVRIGYALGAQVNMGGTDIPLQGHINNKTATLTVGGNNE